MNNFKTIEQIFTRNLQSIFKKKRDAETLTDESTINTTDICTFNYEEKKIFRNQKKKKMTTTKE
jgi:hypothetical protein